MISSDVNFIDFRYLNGACIIKVRFFGQEIAAGENTLHLVIICEFLWQLTCSFLLVLLLSDFVILRALKHECMKLHWIQMAKGCWLPPVWFGPQYIRFPPLSDCPHLNLFCRNVYQWFICIPSGTRPWKWIEDTTTQFIYHKCGLASNTANVHHWVCRPLCPGHIYFMIYKTRYWQQSFLASMRWSLLEVLCMREAQCHVMEWAVFLLCSSAVCLVLYPFVGCSNIFVVNRHRIRWPFVHTRKTELLQVSSFYSNMSHQKHVRGQCHMISVS